MKMTHHVDPEILALWVKGRLDSGQTNEVAMHLERCGRCQTEVDLIRDHFAVESGTDLGARSERLQKEFARRLQTETGGRDTAMAVESSSTVRRHPVRLGRRASLLLAAAAIAFAMIGVRQMILPSAGPPTPSGELRAVEAPSAIQLTLTPETDGWKVGWSARQDLRDLRLTIEDENGKVVLQRELDPADVAVSSVSIPFSELIATPQVRSYFLSLSGLDVEGRRVKSRIQLLPKMANP